MGALRIPSAAELETIEQWLDTRSDLRKSAMDGKPISKFQRRILNKLGTVFSPSSLLSNMATHGAMEHPRGAVTHRLLREAADKSVIDALLISARKHQVKHVAQRVIVEGRQKGFNVVHFRHSDPTFTPDQSVKERCNEVEEFLMRPRRDVHPGGIRDFMVRAVEGELIMDRKVMIIERDRRFRPLNFHLIPPDDVKPRLQVLNPIMARLNVIPGPIGEEQAAEFVYKGTGVDVFDAAYIQEIDGQVVGAWRAEEISVDMALPTSQLDHWHYGKSPLERSLALTTLLIHAFDYNEKLFTVNWPEAFLAVKGDVDQDMLNALTQQIYASVGPQGQQRLPIIGIPENEGAELLKLRDSLREMEYSNLIRLVVALKAASYRAHPSLINMAADSGATAPLISNTSEETQLAAAVEEGLYSLLDNQAQWWSRELVEPWYEDLRVVFSLQDLPTQQQQIEIWNKKLTMGYTIDEFRASQGDLPLADVTGGKVTGDYSNSQFFFQQLQQAQMAQQAMMQTAMPGEPTAPEEAGEQEPPQEPQEQQEQGGYYGA